MNSGAFGENFPYSNFHDLNMDWIIKIAKDFLDQYTNIQNTITNGVTSLQNTTASGIAQLQSKADALESLLNQWYNTHSLDIANQLASALADIQSTLNTAIASFNSSADAKAEQTIASIPDDYTTLFNFTMALSNSLDAESVKGSSSASLTDITWQQGRIGDQGGIISGTNAPNYCMSSALRNSSNAKRINCTVKTGWEFYITEHTSSSLSLATYVRHYPMDKTPTQNEIIIYPTTGHRYTIVIKKTDSSNFTPSEVPADVVTITIWNPTDKTLTIANASADAKATGDLIKTSFQTDYDTITTITSGDLDNYTTPGTYSIPANVYITDITHMPVEAVGMLYVIQMASEAIYQMYIAYTTDGGSVYIRNKSSEAWRDWSKLASSPEVEDAFFTNYSKITRITSGDLDNYTTPGTYSIPANVYITDITHMPVEAVGMLYVIQMASQAIYQMYMAYTADGGSVYIRNKSSQTWRDWSKLATPAEIVNIQKSRFNGKKVSIIGDSIETYVGYVVSGYRTSYPSLGVNSPDKTWWMQMINNTGATLEVNASFSGSLVTNIRPGDEQADHYPDLYERVSVIGSPDIIFVTLGTNDYYYRNSESFDMGEFDFTTAYADLPENKFRQAYIKGIKALQATYPNAEIVCVSEYMNEDFRSSIEYIALTLGAEYINAYDYDRQSGAHPGVLGMQQIASLILYPTSEGLNQKHYPADAYTTGQRVSAIEAKLPTAPTTDGAYVLTVTVNDGTATYSWEST